MEKALAMIQDGTLNFNPHVTTGAAPQGYLDAMIAEPFEAFTFKPDGAAVYQLGTFGTAQRKIASING